MRHNFRAIALVSKNSRFYFFIIIIIIIIVISFMQGIYIYIPKQKMSLGSMVLQLFCSYYSRCI
jgi:hypothetical protein